MHIMACMFSVCAYVCMCYSHQLHEALAALRGDDAEVRLTTAHHLRTGRRGGFGWNYFPQAITIWDSGDREEAWGGPGTDVAISYRERGDKCVMGVYIQNTHRQCKNDSKKICLTQHTHGHGDIFQYFCILPGKTQWLNICTAGRKSD